LIFIEYSTLNLVEKKKKEEINNLLLLTENGSDAATGEI
jgi:hypothetical protein